MKKTLSLIVIVILMILIFLFFRSCEDQNSLDHKIVFPPHKKGEIIVVYKNIPTAEVRQKIKDDIGAQIDISGLDIRQCSNCDSYVELWKADSIHTLIHTKGIRGGTGSTEPVGEDDEAFYSINFISELPLDFSPVNEKYIREHAQDSALLVREISSYGKDSVVVAVLDTGIDTVHFNNLPYLWKNIDSTNCYSGTERGWNFIDNSSDIFDGHTGKHGTLVSHYIINEFANSPINFVQVMTLKTHDNSGKGDLFSNICAIHFAIENNAQIINASWGFYNFENTPHPYLDKLIGEVLEEKRILFIAAAGNKIDEADSIIGEIYKKNNGADIPDDSLRSLSVNHFYPASLAYPESNTVITVTTVHEETTSPTQNFSSSFVDLGVRADLVTPPQMQFKMPFQANVDFVSGSSFAAAIASGKIGAFLPKPQFESGLNKQEVLSMLSGIHITLGVSQFLFHNPELADKKLIRNGRFIIK